jgi:hypothetical protein
MSYQSTTRSGRRYVSPKAIEAIVEETHRPLYSTAARGVGPVQLGDNGVSGDTTLVGAVAVMAVLGLGILWLTKGQRGSGLLALNSCYSCGG